MWEIKIKWEDLKLSKLCAALLDGAFFCFVTGEKQKESVSSKLWKWLYERFGVYIEDFRFQPEENMVETEEPLSAKRWRKHVILILFIKLSSC